MGFVYRWLLRFYEQRRGKLMSMLGLLVAAPLLGMYERDQKGYEERASRNIAKIGRLKLLIAQLQRGFE